MIPLCVPYIRNQEWIRIKDCVDTEWVSYAGKYVEQFEQDLASFTGAQHAAVTISGTSALHIALICAGVRLDDEVILPALSFVAPANAIRYQGAWPTFIDVSMDDWQMDVGQLETFLISCCERNTAGDLINMKTGRRVAAIMPVHLLGGMANLDELVRLANIHQLPLIEDAAESLGAKWKGKGISARLDNQPEIARITCTSFNGNKIMTTGGGGALFTNCEKTVKLAKHLCTTAKTDNIEFDHDQVGYNYRMSNMAAALGIGQLEQLDFFLQRKKEIALSYTSAFCSHKSIQATLPTGDHVSNSYWLYTILLNDNSRPLLNHLANRKIQTRPLWKPLSSLSYLSSCHVVADTNTRNLSAKALSLPCSVGLSPEDQERVIGCVSDYLNKIAG